MAGNIKTYTLADMTPTSPNHVNSKGVELFNRNGLEVALQGNFDDNKQRVSGRSPEQEHSHDELVYMLEGENECFTRDGVERLAFNLVRIPPGVKHGGRVSNGVWISVKPNEFVLKSGNPGTGNVVYVGTRYMSLNYDVRENRVIQQWGPTDTKVIVDDGPTKLKVKIDYNSGNAYIMDFWFRSL